ncbi:hypothetical protein SHIRM173S_02205 [Streptomyces hirsutus]
MLGPRLAYPYVQVLLARHGSPASLKTGRARCEALLRAHGSRKARHLTAEIYDALAEQTLVSAPAPRRPRGIVPAVKAMKGSIRLRKSRGLALRAHWSVPLLMLLLAYGLAARTLPGYVPGLAPVVYAVAGVAGAVLLLASLVVRRGRRTR